jgi:ribose 5-phosphate isomerase B
MIVLGCDHAAFALKVVIREYLLGKGIQVMDFGCFANEKVDYPNVAVKVAKAVSDGTYEKGILFCGTGIGMSICANKIKGIRAAVCSEPYSAKLSRLHNDSNILALGGRVVGIELAKMIVDIWLETPFEAGRHLRKVKMIESIEDGCELS